MKQIITIEIDENEKHTDYATLIMLALYDRRNHIMENFTSENEEIHREIAINCERLIDAIARAKVKRI